MNRPPFSAAIKHLISLGTYLMIRLETNPETAHLAPTVASAVNDVKKEGEAVEAADVETMRKLAARDAADERADTLVSSFARKLLDHFGGDRSAPLYRRLLSDGVNGINQVPHAEELIKIRELSAALAQAELPEALKTLGTELLAAGEALAAAMKEHEAAVREESLKKGDLMLAKDRWHTTYVRTHGLLVGLFGSKARADRFYKSFHGSRAAAEDGDAGDADAQ
jgi:hypothetical protein